MVGQTHAKENKKRKKNAQDPHFMNNIYTWVWRCLHASLMIHACVLYYMIHEYYMYVHITAQIRIPLDATEISKSCICLMPPKWRSLAFWICEAHTLVDF